MRISNATNTYVRSVSPAKWLGQLFGWIKIFRSPVMQSRKKYAFALRFRNYFGKQFAVIGWRLPGGLQEVLSLCWSRLIQHRQLDRQCVPGRCSSCSTVRCPVRHGFTCPASCIRQCASGCSRHMFVREGAGRRATGGSEYATDRHVRLPCCGNLQGIGCPIHRHSERLVTCRECRHGWNRLPNPAWIKIGEGLA